MARLAHARLFSGRGGAGTSSGVGREMRNRLSATCCGVRTQGARVKTVATVAMRFLKPKHGAIHKGFRRRGELEAERIRFSSRLVSSTISRSAIASHTTTRLNG